MGVTPQKKEGISLKNGTQKFVSHVFITLRNEDVEGYDMTAHFAETVAFLETCRREHRKVLLTVNQSDSVAELSTALPPRAKGTRLPKDPAVLKILRRTTRSKFAITQ